MKKWLLIGFLSVICVFSGIQIKKANAGYSDVVTQKANFNQVVQGSTNIVLEKPLTTKMYEKKTGLTFLRVKIPYKVSFPIEMRASKTLTTHINFSDLIRVEAGGMVWQANPQKGLILTAKKYKRSGAVNVDLIIQQGYSEQALRNYRVYLKYPSNTTSNILYRFS